MHKLRLTGWRYGLRKVSMTQALQRHARLSLSEAKQVTDRVLDGELVDIECPTESDRLLLGEALVALGADVVLDQTQSNSRPDSENE
jgi:hypothetical protein